VPEAIAGVPRSAEGERRALFRVHLPGAGGHHYATLREHLAGPLRFSLEVRRGLVWGYTEAVLLVTAEAPAREGDPCAVVVHVSGGRTATGRNAASDDLEGFAREALAVAGERLGVAPAAFVAADHVDLGEAGTLGLDAELQRRSAALLTRAAESPAARIPEPGPVSGSLAPVPATPGPAVAAARDLSPSPVATPNIVAASVSDDVPSAPAAPGPEPGPPPRTTLLGRLVGWLRRAARAALGR